MEKDKVFAQIKEKLEPFSFNEKVTRVFDDMLNRSVPLYRESIKQQAQLAEKYYIPETRIYDLGCSNGNLGLQVLKQMKNRSFTMVGVDSSIPMIDTYAERLKDSEGRSNVHLVCGLLENLLIENASVVLINLTLQFLAPDKRDDLISTIYKGLKPGGLLLLTEKTVHRSENLNALQMEFYNHFKLENGYSELEISQKRDALEKVLIPDTIEAHQRRLKDAGFQSVDIWLKWFNFSSMMAVK